jgi:hypothetical protein
MMLWGAMGYAKADIAVIWKGRSKWEAGGGGTL